MDLSPLPENYRRVVTAALERIRAASPEDHRLLMDFVEAVELVEFEEEDRRGLWLQSERAPTREEVWADERIADGIRWGKIQIASGLDEHQFLLVFVHEAGHAATRMDDLEAVGGPTDELRGELAADRKAIEWGFREEVMERRKTGEPFHHFGQAWREENGTRWILTDDLRIVDGGPAEGSSPR